MRRIGFTLVFALSLLVPLSVEAQPAGTVPRVGWLSTYSGYCGERDRGVEGDYVWMTCSCGAALVRVPAFG
jgi:hypothetical protein